MICIFRVAQCKTRMWRRRFRRGLGEMTVEGDEEAGILSPRVVELGWVVICLLALGSVCVHT